MLQLQFFAALRGQKGVALDLLRGPPWIKVSPLQLPFFVVQKKVFTSRFPMI